MGCAAPTQLRERPGLVAAGSLETEPGGRRQVWVERRASTMLAAHSACEHATHGLTHSLHGSPGGESRCRAQPGQRPGGGSEPGVSKEMEGGLGEPRMESMERGLQLWPGLLGCERVLGYRGEEKGLQGPAGCRHPGKR